MKQRLLSVGVLCLVVIMLGCHDAPIGDDFADTYYAPEGAVISPRNVQVGFYDLGDPDNASIAFDLHTLGEDVVSSEITATHSDGASTVYTSVASFPSTVEVPLPDLLTALNLPVDSVNVGESILFTFTATTANGTYRSSEVLSVPFSCNSKLEGTLDYTSTSFFCTEADFSGTVELKRSGAGQYTFSDWTFGTYPVCYGGFVAAGFGSLKLVDICNRISVTGVDNYGDSWTFTINSVSGSELNGSWENTYGEFGTVTLTRQDGEDWPPLTN